MEPPDSRTEIIREDQHCPEVEDTASAITCLRHERRCAARASTGMRATLDIIIATALGLVAIIVCYPILLLVEAIKGRPTN